MASIDSAQFPKALAALKNLPQVLFLIGEEDALSSDCLKLFREAFGRLYGEAMIDFNQDVFYGEKDDAARVLDACATLPVGMDRRLVILHQAEKISSESEDEIEKYLSSPNPSTVFVMISGGKPNQQTLSKGLPAASEKQGLLVRCWKMNFEEQKVEWIKTQLAAYHMEITREAAQLLARDGGEGMRELKGEIEKLVLFVDAKKNVEISDVRQTMSFRADQIIFNFVNELEAGRIKKAGAAMERCLEQGEEPIFILNMMARSARRMSQGKGEKSRAKQLELFRGLKEADLALKSGYGLESGLFERMLPAYAALAN